MANIRESRAGVRGAILLTAMREPSIFAEGAKETKQLSTGQTAGRHEIRQHAQAVQVWPVLEVWRIMTFSYIWKFQSIHALRANSLPRIL